MLESMVCFTEPKSVITVMLCTGGQTKKCKSEKPSGMWLTSREPHKLSVVQTLNIRSCSPTNKVNKGDIQSSSEEQMSRAYLGIFFSFRKILFHLKNLSLLSSRKISD